MTVYARTTTAFGTNTNVIIVSNKRVSRMEPVASAAVDLLRRFISAGARGLKLSAMQGNEIALADLGRLGLRFSRSRCLGTIKIVGNVEIVDQRTFSREVA